MIKRQIISLIAIVACFSLILISGCKRSEVENPVEAQPANMADADNAVKAETDSDNAVKDEKNEASETAEPEAKSEIKPIAIPELSGVKAQNQDTACDETGCAFTYGVDMQDDAVQQYRRVLQDNGFVRPNRDEGRDLYKKLDGDAVAVVILEGGEGELIVRHYRTEDPQGLYADLPDKRIPCPLQDGLAAEHGDVTLPSEDSRETVYPFYNIKHEFVTNYIDRLEQAGFKNTGSNESPYYIKTTNDGIELGVKIDEVNADKPYHDVRYIYYKKL